MQGMSKENGIYLDDLAYLKQSIIDILTTPIGSRVMCRNYGSNLFYLLDRPINRAFFPQIYAAVAEAIGKWEPRLKLDKVRVVEIKDGRNSSPRFEKHSQRFSLSSESLESEAAIILSLAGTYLVTQQKIELKDIKI